MTDPLVGQIILPYGFEVGARFRLVSGNPFTPAENGSTFVDGDADGYRNDLSAVPRNSGRMPAFHQLDVRIDKTWTFDWWKLTAYLEVLNVYNQRNVEAFQYDYRSVEKTPVSLLPLLPVHLLILAPLVERPRLRFAVLALLLGLQVLITRGYVAWSIII